MRNLLRALRYTTRQLIRSPGFTVTVVLILGLGIGATTAIFSLVEGVLLRPLAFRDPDRLVILGDHVGGNSGIGVTAREIAAYATASSAFSSVGGYATGRFELSGGATPQTVDAARCTAALFTTLGVPPMLGRVFTQQEVAANQAVAVIGYSLWVDRYHQDPHILGASISLDRKAYSIVGVMPRNFQFPLATGRFDRTQLWIPMSLTPEELSAGNAGYWGYKLIARLKEGTTLQQAAADANRVAQQTMRIFPPALSAIHIQGDVEPLRTTVVADAGPLLRVLFLAVSVVLLIACANVAGLLLVRAIRRRRERAVRVALGARSSTIVRESVFEGLLLSLAGGLMGMAMAAVAVRLAPQVLPESMPRLDSIYIDARVTAFALLLAVATGVLCGLAPAYAALRTNLLESLKEGVSTGTSAASHPWLSSALVIAEIAIALVLLNLSGAFLRSFQKMRAVDPGYRADHVVVAGFQLPLGQYPTQASAEAFNRAVLARLDHKPGVVAAGITSFLPATDFTAMSAYTIEGQPAEGWKLKFAAFSPTDGNYFKAMGIPLLDGRTFAPEDGSDNSPVVIVNKSMAQHCWGGQRAIGKRMHVGSPRKAMPWATVVGVVADTKLGSPDEPSGDQWYLPAEQASILYGAKFDGVLTSPAGGYVVLRSVLPAELMIQTVRSSVSEIDPLLALEHVETMKSVASEIEAPRRFNTGLVTGFALCALLLAVAGIYSVIAFSVSLRAQDLAIRVALGARRSGIAKLVLLSAAKLAFLGCGLGVLGSVALSRVVSSFLFDVSATSPAIYLAGVAIMMLIALSASALPAARAASTDPIRVLRSF